MQIEESYIGADEFCRVVKQIPQTVLRHELPVIQGLGFDLITHPPLRAIDGLFRVSYVMHRGLGCRASSR